MKKLLIILVVMLGACAPLRTASVADVDCRLLSPIQSTHVRDRIADCVTHSGHGLEWCSRTMKTIYCPLKKNIIYTTGTNNDG